MSISIQASFSSSLVDPRVERNRRHDFMDIILLVICAVISGANGWEDIEEFGHSKLGWLRKFARFANEVPSHDYIANVFSRISVAGFQQCFRNWTEAVMQSLGGEVVAIDGKTARGSGNRRRGRKALHMMSAWASNTRLVLSQESTDEKSNGGIRQGSCALRAVQVLDLQRINHVAPS